MRSRALVALAASLVVVGVVTYFLYPTLVFLFSSERLEKAERYRLLGITTPQEIAKARLSGKSQGSSVKVVSLGADYLGGVELYVDVDTVGSGYSEAQMRGAVNYTLETIKTRVAKLGVRKAEVKRVEKNRILVRMVGVTDSADAVDVLGNFGMLEFRFLADDLKTREVFTAIDSVVSLDSTRVLRSFTSFLVHLANNTGVAEKDYERVKEILAKASSAISPDVEILWGQMEKEEDRNYFSIYVVEKEAKLTSADIEASEVEARPYTGMDPVFSGTWMVEIGLKKDSQVRFALLTDANIGRRLAIVLDGKVLTAPSIKERIPPGSKVTLTMQDRTGDEAREMEERIKGGFFSLPLKVVDARIDTPQKAKVLTLALIMVASMAVVGILVFVGVFRVLRVKAGYEDEKGDSNEERNG